MNSLEELMERAEETLVVLKAPENPFVPIKLTNKQRDFVKSVADEVLYGGAAGGGKTVALLAAAAEHVEHSNYSAVIFRRTFPQLKQNGGILDLADEWWANMEGVRWDAANTTYIFPSGAKIKFSHMKDERDKLNHQGGQYHFLGYDELTQFSETQFTYLKTRRRKNHGDPIPLITRSTTNPGGEGHFWVKKRYITAPAEGHVFMPATMEDNPHLDRDSYAKSFDGLDKTTRDQLKDGKWIDNAGGIVYPIPDTSILSFFKPSRTTHYIISVDLGSSEKYPSTAFVVGVWDDNVPNTVWIIHTEKKAGMTPSTIAGHLKSLLMQFPADRIIVDPGALGGGYIKDFRQRYQLPVFHAEKRDKLGNRRLLIGDLEDGYLRFVQPGADALLEECAVLQWNMKGTDVADSAVDHLADAMLYLYRDAKAWMSREVAPPPVYGSPEWQAQQEEQMIEDEIRRSQMGRMENGYGY